MNATTEKKFKKLIEEIKSLNAPQEYEGELLESQFEFVFDGEALYDMNENYTIDYAENTACLSYDFLRYEMGIPAELIKIDSEDHIKQRFEKALPEEYIIEWETNTRLMVHKNS